MNNFKNAIYKVLNQPLLLKVGVWTEEVGQGKK